MEKFVVYLTKQAEQDLKDHKKSGNKSTEKKIKKILDELKKHPESGTGKPERLKYELNQYWSRRINRKDRIIYSIDHDIVTVEVVSAIGHYKDR